jgi:3-methylcrotonyl-CoA carboxylase beta subunit
MRPLLRLGLNTLRQSYRRISIVQRKNPNRSIATHTFSHHASAISVLPTKIDTSSNEYKDNASKFGEIMAHMQRLHEQIHEGGPPKAREKHIARGKMLPREYVLISPNSATDGIFLQPYYSSYRYWHSVPGIVALGRA